MRKSIRRTSVLAAAAAAIAATPMAASAEKLKVALPQKGLWETSITIIGMKQGLFKKEGLDLEILHTRGGSETVQAVLSGSVDMARSNGILGTIGGYAKGAPIRIIGASMTGAPDAFWYARSDSGIKTPKDLQGKKIGFSRPGSSTHLMVLALIAQYKLDKARGVPSGGPSGSFTQTMSKQIDAGWSVPPFRLKDVAAGKLTIVARASELDEIKGQTIRVNVTSANALKSKREALTKYHRAWLKALDFAYSNDKALEIYAGFAKGVDIETARETRKMYPKEALLPFEIGKLDLSLKQAEEFKFIKKPMKAADVKGLIDILVKK
ncbi:MAG: ABC transporter substrate-binding protein [Hyphomicrobiales bacterium]|nr:ABC transporter substrate-binding protein [Hyphomicrobiales bacterium]